MSDIIHLLPDVIANQIAAGEVIQRPASAVKELMENAIDAGATTIKLIIKEGGTKLIQIVDNGCGMSATDARMSFEKHATSKIKSVDDLFAIQTMGFRGEALASVAAIAQVDLKTRLHDQELGTQLIIEGGEVKSQEPCQCPEGTSISVKNLFYNVPARRNFLKSESVELRHIMEEFQRIALIHPDIQFSFFNNDNEVFHLNKGNLKQRIAGLFGDKSAQKIVQVEEKTDVVNISGFIGKPEFAKKTRGEQFIFVNKRFIKSAYLNHAIIAAYEGLLQDKSYPFYMLSLEIDPSKIDVNVHPTKQEIKFEDEQIIYTFVKAAVKHSLGQFTVAPKLDFELDTNISNMRGFVHTPTIKEKSAVVNQPSKQGSFRTGSLKTTLPDNWEELYEISKQPIKQKEITISESDKGEDIIEQATEKEEKTKPFQIHQQYILCQIKSGFILIDQQAAHERILYEKYMQSFNGSVVSIQKELFPQTLEFNVPDATILKEILPQVNQLGFDIQEFGKNAFVIHGTPTDISMFREVNAQVVIENLVEQYKNNQQSVKKEKGEFIAKTLAKSGALRRGKKLSAEEMEKLIGMLFVCQQPNYTPDGRATIITFNEQDLEKLFNR